MEARVLCKRLKRHCPDGLKGLAAYACIAALLGGCVAATTPPAPRPALPDPTPIIADVNLGQVKIQFPTILNLAFQPVSAATATLQAEADRACTLYGRIASQPISKRCSAVQIFLDLELSDFDEIGCRMKTWGTAPGNDHGYCKTQEYLFACTPQDGKD